MVGWKAGFESVNVAEDEVFCVTGVNPPHTINSKLMNYNTGSLLSEKHEIIVDNIIMFKPSKK